MNHAPRRRTVRRRVFVAMLTTALSLSVVMVLTAPARSVEATRAGRAQARSVVHDAQFDVRARGSAAGVAPRVAAARTSLARRLGSQGVIQSDRVTGTLRFLGRLDGYLTGPSARTASDVAMGYVRDHLSAFGLSRADLRSFLLRNDYVDIAGTHHLSWIQRYRGIPVFANGLKANVTGEGRLINVNGAPVHHVRPATTRPRIGSTGAIGAARRSVGASAAASRRDTSTLVLFATGRGTRLAWRTITFVSSTEIDLSVVDAVTGGVLWRTNLVKSDAVGTGSAWGLTASSGVPNGGGTAAPVTFPVADGTALSGNNAHAWADINGDDLAQASEEVPAASGLDWSTYTAPLDTTTTSQNCTSLRPCTWDASTPFSWQANLQHNVEQVYYFLNVYHDHLEAAPYGFTEAAGNFQKVNASGQGEGGDPVLGQAMDGANTDNGFPDGNHIDNANMSTFPDGESPIMQMYLFAAVPGLEGLPSANGGDDAEVLFHEYTHGLSNRLVTFPDGTGAVGSVQAGAMGEGWSDWYATDALNSMGFKPDDPGDGNLIMGYYTFAGLLRFNPIDCPPGAGGSACPGTPGAGSGGFTYGDFGKVAGVPEVHSDGEIWLETLWDLRNAVGATTAEGLVTRAMELSPPEPSYLDMRNAILQADLVNNAGANQDGIWQVFADRGMGYFAAAVDGGDAKPVQDFSMPVDCATATCGTIKGRVTNKITGKPIAHADVFVAGLNSGFAGDLGDTTDQRGRYKIRDVPFHDSYPEIVMSARGFEDRLARHVVVDGTETLNRNLNRDWAALEGGAKFLKATPPDYSDFGCPPTAAFDLSIGTGWGSDAPDSTFGSNHTGPRKVSVKLPKTIRISSFGLASGGACGDGPEAAVKGFTIQTRRVGGGWVTVFKGNARNDSRLHTLKPSGPAGLSRVRFVQFIMRSNHGDDLFMDMLELTVRGR